MFADLAVLYTFLISFSQHCTCLFSFREFPSTLLNESVRALPAVCNSLTQLDAVCQKHWRVMGCLGERSLSSGMLLQTALIEDCTTTATWLWEPMRKFWSWLHSLITRTLIHPLSCCKVEMLPQQLPSPTLLRSARHRWMCTRILLQNDPLAYFTLQSFYGVAMHSDSDLCGSHLTLIGMWTVYCDTLCMCACCHVCLLPCCMCACCHDDVWFYFSAG